MEFYTKYRRPKHNGSEPGGGQLVVERAGYVDTKTQIENFIRSGELLAAHRSSFYEFPQQMTEDEEDSRMPIMSIYPQDNVDVDEFTRRMNSVRREIKAEKEINEAAEKNAALDAALAARVVGTPEAGTVPPEAGTVPQKG